MSAVCRHRNRNTRLRAAVWSLSTPGRRPQHPLACRMCFPASREAAFLVEIGQNPVIIVHVTFQAAECVGVEGLQIGQISDTTVIPDDGKDVGIFPEKVNFLLDFMKFQRHHLSPFLFEIR